MDGGSGFGPHFVWTRLVVVAAVLVMLVVVVPGQRAGAIVVHAIPPAAVAATAPGPGLGPSSETVVGRPLSSRSRGREDRRPVLARAAARPSAEHARVSALDREVLARFD
ncbi:hypothetical protein MHN80_07255 [Gordonia McavH-238-E]|uniref:hypothetical protein n=1 Tax=Gordonia sp. McavH-238-E TaxID=2917736 RepID=UPI001EF6C7C7|nr:hypothetical protein [Gordonia sp. McavH-238-E]MCG7632106.1 hypothetical protein [Gordonia sp. McavH-238-E]